MNSAQLVNLILEKLRRVEFVSIEDDPKTYVKFLWGGNEYAATVSFDRSILVYRFIGQGVCIVDNYQRHVEGRLNGMVRNDAGELVQP